MMYPDAEDVTMGLVGDIADAVTATPANINRVVVQVQRVGGTDNGHTDFPIMAVTVKAPYVDTDAQSGREQVWEVSGLIRDRVLGSPATRVRTTKYPDGIVIDNARTDPGPRQIPYGDSTVATATTHYRLALRAF